MKNDVREFVKKIRILSACIVIALVVLVLFFTFLSQREKTNASVKLKLFYSDMVQTMQYSVADNGSVADWNWKIKDKAGFLNDYIIKYLRVSQNCLSSKGGCFSSRSYFNLAGLRTNYNLSKFPSVILQNGISLAFDLNNNCAKNDSVCATVFVDLNNKNEPNKFGKDLFVFVIKNTESVPFVPFKHVNDTSIFLNDKRYGCNKYAEMPMYCAAYLLSTNWFIDSNYPW